MGQYYIIYNQDKQQSVKPAFANWKLGEFNFDEIIQIMNWSKDDIIYAIGDYGDIIIYNGDEDDINEDIYEMKFICNFTKKVVDKEYSYEEFIKLYMLMSK